MKKQIKEELFDLAEEILQNRNEKTSDTGQLKRKARLLYEKLSILHFTEKHLSSAETPAPEVQKKNVKTPENDLAEEDDYAPTGLEFNDSDAITEPNTEKIKDIVANMPTEAERIEEMFKSTRPKPAKNDMEDIGGVHYDHLPQFEPVKNKDQEPEKPRSLNDRLKSSFQIGVNERHVFIKKLFDGSSADYNRVLSQLNTLKTKEEAVNFVLNMVKPDYNNWEGREEYEIRFLALVENKFE